MQSSETVESGSCIRIRGYRPADFDALSSLINGAGRLMTRTGLVEHLDSPMLHAGTDVFVLDRSDGSGLVGVRDVRLTGRGDESEPILESWGMLADDAPPGAFDALLQSAITRAGEIVRGRGARVGVLQTRCDSRETATQNALESNGLRSVRELWTIVRPTLEGVAEARFAPHIQVRAYRFGDEAAWVAAFNDAFADHFGGWMGMSLPAWTRYVTSPIFKPDISLVAWHDDQIAGFGHFRIDEELNAMLGRRQGMMRYIGVRPAWRRQGLARALTRAGLHALRAHGMHACVSGVDGTNTTGAHLLYLDEGFHVHSRELLYRISVG
jgi:ribosomal protein S18 acetylase RimI-like enzyme